jgi:hypothetical protein
MKSLNINYDEESIKKFFEESERKVLKEKEWIERMKLRIEGDIDSSIERLLAWYESDKYRDREYARGYEPRETLLWLLFKYATEYGETCLDDSELYETYGNMFTGGMYRIGSYVIQVMHGQGSVIRIDKIK